MKSLHLSHSFPANWMKVSEEMKLLAFGALGFTRNGLNLHPLGGLAELVDCTGLENRRAARYRGFESLSLRKRNRQRCWFFLCPTFPQRTALYFRFTCCSIHFHAGRLPVPLLAPSY